MKLEHSQKNSLRSSNIPSCNCLTIDHALVLIYYSIDEEILTATISITDFKSLKFTNSTYYLPYSNGKFTGISPSSCPMDCGATGDCMVTPLSSSFGGEGECVCYENNYSSDCSVYCSDSTTCSKYV